MDQWMVGLRTKTGVCCLTPTAALRVVPDTDKTHSDVKPVGRRFGVSYKRLISANQDRRWVCVHWGKGKFCLLMASKTEALICGLCEFSLIKSQNTTNEAHFLCIAFYHFILILLIYPGTVFSILCYINIYLHVFMVCLCPFHVKHLMHELLLL